MSTMLDATEKTKPIMEYVRQLENRVRSLRQERLRFRSVTFLFGMATGGVLSWIVAAGAWLLARHR